MGFFEWLGISPRDAPELPEVTDNVRDSGQTFVFGKADSGEKVDEKSAMQIATVYACVRLLAETVAGLPLHLYRMKDGSNAKERAVDHPLYKLLYRQPNPEMTSFSPTGMRRGRFITSTTLIPMRFPVSRTRISTSAMTRCSMFRASASMVWWAFHPSP